MEISNGDIANLGWFQLQDFVGVSGMDPVTLYGSIENPSESANPGLLAAGAAPWGINSEIESFSSRGPTPDGRIKPDIVGADRADTEAYGPAGFPGTSQGTPHVAGLAALVLQHFPAYTPAEVAQYLKDNADQRTEPSPDNTDPNNIWGHGYADLPSVPSTPSGPSVTGATPDEDALTITWEEPTYTGSSTITAYDVRYRETGVTDWQPVLQNAWTSGALEYTISGLTSNTEYDVQVRAVNANGDGAWSRITLHSTLTATATAANPLRATTTDTVVLSTTAMDTIQAGPDDVLAFAPPTATEAGLMVRKTAAEKLEITTNATTTVSKTTGTTTLEFGPDHPLTITLPRRGESATLTFFTVDGTNVERVATHSLKQIPPPPPPPPPPTTSSSSTSRKRSRTPAPAPTPEPRFSASNSIATVNEREDGPGQSSLVFQRHDRPEASFDLPIGWISRDGTQQIPLGFVRDESLGQTYAILRRESDGQIVRWWIAGNSPWVYAVPWAEVNSRFTVPLAVLALIPLDDQYPQPNQLVRRFDGGDDRILAYDAGLKQWRHVPDLATFQALGFYWCDVTAADGAFFERITLGPPYPASSTPARSDYPSCRT